MDRTKALIAGLAGFRNDPSDDEIKGKIKKVVRDWNKTGMITLGEFMALVLEIYDRRN